MGRIVEKGTTRVEGAGLKVQSQNGGVHITGGGQRQPLFHISRVQRG